MCEQLRIEVPIPKMQATPRLVEESEIAFRFTALANGARFCTAVLPINTNHPIQLVVHNCHHHCVMEARRLGDYIERSTDGGARFLDVRRQRPKRSSPPQALQAGWAYADVQHTKEQEVRVREQLIFCL